MVHSAFFLRVDVCLREYFIDSIVGSKSMWIRTWHAFNFNAVIIAISINSEQTLKLALRKPMVNSSSKLVHNMLGVLVIAILRFVKSIHVSELV